MGASVSGDQVELSEQKSLLPEAGDCRTDRGSEARFRYLIGLYGRAPEKQGDKGTAIGR